MTTTMPAPAEAAPAVEPMARSSRSWLRRLGPLGIACAVILGIAVVLAIIGPYLPGLDPESTDLPNAWVGPFQLPGSPLGFDAQGRDLLSRLIFGARTAIVGPLIVLIIAMSLGVTIGMIAAWRRGWLDSFLNFGLDILFGFPGILLAIVAAAVFGGGLWAAAIALSVAYLPFIARVVRNAAAKEDAMEYVAALRVQGVSAWRISVRHILPNISPIIVAQGTILFGYALVDLVAISFLGLGVQPPAADWGVMVNENLIGVLQGYPLPALAAGLVIVTVVVAVNVLGERLLDISEGRR